MLYYNISIPLIDVTAFIINTNNFKISSGQENRIYDITVIITDKCTLINYSINVKLKKKMAKEIFTIAGIMWALTLTGLSVGFGLLKIQGE